VSRFALLWINALDLAAGGLLVAGGAYVRFGPAAAGAVAPLALALLVIGAVLLAGVLASAFGIAYNAKALLRVSVWLCLPAALAQVGVAFAALAKRAAIEAYATEHSATLRNSSDGGRHVIALFFVVAFVSVAVEVARYNVSHGLRHSLSADVRDLMMSLNADETHEESTRRERVDERRTRYDQLRQHYKGKYSPAAPEQKDAAHEADRNALFGV